RRAAELEQEGRVRRARRARCTRSRLLSADPGASIDQRLAAAGLPPLPRTAWAEIDLDALTANLAVLRRLAGPGTPVHPVIKGNAYGHGVLPVARALVAAGADGFCVATFDEALRLRRAGIALPVLVLFGIPAALAGVAAGEGIAVTADDAALLDALLAALRDSAPDRPLDIQLEVETGLGRGGFPLNAVVAAARAIADVDGARLTGVWTHFQAPEDAARTNAQVQRFEEATETLAAAGFNLPRHVAASGGLVLVGDLGLDGARPGLSLYGLIPDDLLAPGAPALAQGAEELRPVLSLRARPVRVLEVPAGWGISYGPTFTTQRPSRIATLPLGYGDGWSRALSNRASALVRGTRVPLVGNVAMDAVMADVTDVPGVPVTVADEFVLIGEQGGDRITAAEVATARGTNSWEVVTTLSARLPRVYDAAAVPQGLLTLTGDDSAGRS
ncbi:MAG TPA: alanine racemase, partial [Candidatus Limnocylindrales bacterium]|nr:alanine racemase [Candidatus Limnocylindrales bacterium]